MLYEGKRAFGQAVSLLGELVCLFIWKDPEKIDINTQNLLKFCDGNDIIILLIKIIHGKYKRRQQTVKELLPDESCCFGEIYANEELDI